MNNEYSISLFDLGKEENILDAFYNDLKEIEKIFNEEEVKDFFSNKFIKVNDKKEIINKSLKGCHKYIYNFINLLIDDNKISEIEDIFNNFNELYYKEKKIIIGTIYGIEISEENKKKLEEVFKEKLKKEVRLNFKKDISLVGGYKVVVDNKSYDNSYKRKLNNLKEVLMKEGEIND